MKDIETNSYKIEELLTRGVEDVFVYESLKKKLHSKKQLRVKLGFDPTGSTVHIGRATVLRKLKTFQDLGHIIIFIVGDFTAQIGDPSDKLEKRPMLTKEEITTNLSAYKEQIGKIIDLKKTEFRFNSEWLGELGFQEVTELAESFSVQQMVSRRNFKERFDTGREISLREFMYPLMQGYDSVMVGADVEIGGSDQLFNLKAGRVIQKHYGKPEQDILTTEMLLGTDGRKMSTSWGNVITVTDEPFDMFGKVMALNDELIGDYFRLATTVSKEELENIKKSLREGSNPRDIKLRLGREIVTLYHNEKEAHQAQEQFLSTFRGGGVPENILTVTASPHTLLSHVLLKEKLISSKSEFRRLVEGRAITYLDSSEKVTDFEEKVKEGVYKIGKKRFIKVTL